MSRVISPKVSRREARKRQCEPRDGWATGAGGGERVGPELVSWLGFNKFGAEFLVLVESEREAVPVVEPALWLGSKGGPQLAENF